MNITRKCRTGDTKVYECWVSISNTEKPIEEMLSELNLILRMVSNESIRNSKIKIVGMNQECWDTWTTGKTYKKSWCIDMLLDKEGMDEMDKLTRDMKYFCGFCRPLV